MRMNEITIGKRTIVWSYFATALQIGSGILLFPIILRKLPSEIIGIWSIFTAITVFVNMLDFGFTPSFTRNITYIFSGVKSLRKSGICEEAHTSEINYLLLNNTIKAMKWLYLRIALISLILQLTAGSCYMYFVLQANYHGDTCIIWVSWLIFCVTNTYNIYTLYYDCLLLGRGLVKEDKKTVLIAQLINFLIAFILIFLGFGLLSIVIAQIVSLFVKRRLSIKYFYTKEMKSLLQNQKEDSSFKDILKVVLPNSIKLGFTGLGGFLALQSSVFIGALNLSLDKMASYGITVQVVNVIASIGSVYYFSHTPKFAQLRVHNDLLQIRKLYIKSVGLLLLSFLVCGAVLVFAGNWMLVLIGAKTLLIDKGLIVGLLIIILLEKNHAIAGGVLLSKNEVPFFRASIFAGVLTVLLLLIFFKFFDFGVLTMILAPGIAQIIYQNWKWPSMLMNELKIKG